MKLNGSFFFVQLFYAYPPFFLTWKRDAGHDFIDVLKIDIEGAEFGTLSNFLDVNKPGSSFSSTTLPIGQLQLELHAWDDYANFAFFHDWWTSLEAAGLRPFWTEPNLVYVNYNDATKPQLSEVGDIKLLTKMPMLTTCVCQYSFINIRGDHALVHEPTEEGRVI